MIINAKQQYDQTVVAQLNYVEKVIESASSTGYFKVRIHLELCEQVVEYFKDLGFVYEEDTENNERFFSWNSI